MGQKQAIALSSVQSVYTVYDLKLIRVYNMLSHQPLLLQ